jgi:protein involved in polysaccharide export with SLBB domain
MRVKMKRGYITRSRLKAWLSKSRHSLLIFSFLVVHLLGGCGGKSRTVGAENGGQVNELVSPPVLQEFVIGAGDQISVQVFGHHEFDRKVNVSPTGEIYYPLLGYLNIEGMTAKELRVFLTEKISKYYVDPEVGISIVAVKSQKIFILGEVRQPGVYPLEFPITTFELVLRAGGFNDRAKKSNILLLRGTGEEAVVHKLDLERVYQKGDHEDNIYVQGGDIVYVPQNILTNIEDFIGHMTTFMRPFLDIERGVILWPTFVDVLEGEDTRRR